VREQMFLPAFDSGAAVNIRTISTLITCPTYRVIGKTTKAIWSFM